MSVTDREYNRSGNSSDRHGTQITLLKHLDKERTVVSTNRHVQCYGNRTAIMQSALVTYEVTIPCAMVALGS